MKRPSYRVHLLRIAEDDLIDIATFIAQDNPPAAEILLQKIDKAFNHLETYPFLGKVPYEEELSNLGYRYIIVGTNYLIFYTLQGQTILIHRIIHGARNYVPLLL